MVGIKTYGAYIPKYRLQKKEIYNAWGWFAPGLAGYSRGEKAVANVDEDSITMAVAAGLNALDHSLKHEIDGLYFASTTAPYVERGGSSLMIHPLGLNQEIRTADYTDTLKAGTAAVLAGADAVACNSLSNVLVCAADNRLGKPGSYQEYLFGDGAAAVVIGNDHLIAELQGTYSLSMDFADHRRAAGDIYDRAWEDRWIREEGYAKIIPELAKGILTKYNWNLTDFSMVIFRVPEPKEYQSMAKRLGLKKEQVNDSMLDTVGDTGAAHALLLLVAALEKAKPGNKILLLDYGNGGNALAFQVTEEIENLRHPSKVLELIEQKEQLENYEKYAVFKKALDVERGIRGDEIALASISVLWREKNTILGLCGSRCTKCGTPQYPAQRVCVNPECKAIDQMEEYCFAERRGKLFTYTGDSLAFSLNPPAIYGMVEFDGGGRYWFDLTDTKLEDIEVDMQVQMTFRRKIDDPSRGFYGYCWKAVPCKNAEVKNNG